MAKNTKLGKQQVNGCEKDKNIFEDVNKGSKTIPCI